MNKTHIGKFRISGEWLYDCGGYNMIAKLFAYFKIVPVRCEQFWHNRELEYIAISDVAFLPIEEGSEVPEYECTVATIRDETSGEFSIDLENCYFKEKK